MYNGQNVTKIGSFFSEVLFYQFIFLKKKSFKVFFILRHQKNNDVQKTKNWIFWDQIQFSKESCDPNFTKFSQDFTVTNLSQMHTNN